MKPIFQGLFMPPNLGEHRNSRNETQTHHQSRAGNADRCKKSLRTYRHSCFLYWLPADRLPQALWYLGVANLIRVKINDVDPHIMLHFAFPQVMQMGAPLAILFQVVSHM